MKKVLLLFVLIVTTLFSSCSSRMEKKLPIPEDFTPNYEIVSQDDIQYKSDGYDIFRYSFRIILPEGLTEKEIKYNFRKIVLDTYEETNIKNISIFAYLDIVEANGPYTIAMYEFCPYGDWSRTDECYSTPTESYEENLIVNPSYFIETTESPKEDVAIDDYVILNRKTKWNSSTQKLVPASNVKVSKNKRDFNDENVTYVNNGTKVKILDIYSERLSSTSKWVVYKIKTSNNFIGWVYKEDTMPMSN